ncbi:MAG: AAA family ATPase [Clostridia bacterium]|nr:AAA family ATPase [Clostridia bacterium]
MKLSHAKNDLYKNIETVLCNLLKVQNPNFTFMADKNLLLLETASDSVGFTILNGNWENTYSSAYMFFKQIYRENHTSWNERCLSFVACYPKIEGNEIFLNAIEMDVYFCKKYTIQYITDINDFEQELLRLPFLPIDSCRIEGITRPPSAQTLLQNNGINATLSRNIITPGLRSALRIIDDLNNQQEQLPDIYDITDNTSLREQILPQSTRMKHLSIEAFRAYKKKQEFDLDADIIVLYGQNGVGKTSFFDAIDYVCTGRIGRLCQNYNMTQEQFTKIAQHLSEPDSTGNVIMDIENAGIDYQIKRDVTDWSNTYINKEKYDRINTLKLITSANWGEKNERVVQIEKLFRATHLFGQTSPELLIDFEKDSTLSSDLVSRTFALEDYASGSTKLDEIISHLDTQITKDKKQLDGLEKELKFLGDQISELSLPLNTVQISEQLNKMVIDLCMKMHANDNIIKENTPITIETIRAQRSFLEAKFNTAKNNFFKLHELEEQFILHCNNCNKYKLLVDLSTKLSEDMQQQENELKQLEKDKLSIIKSLKKSMSDISNLRNKLDNLVNLESIKASFTQARDKFEYFNNELKQLDFTVTETDKQLNSLFTDMQTIKNKTSKNCYDSEITKSRIDRLNKINNEFDNWEKQKEEIKTLQSTIDGNMLKLADISNQKTKNNYLINENNSKLEIYEVEYKKLVTDNNELTRLLDELEQHVVDGVCPTCGINHNSKTTLINRIHMQKGKRPINVENAAKNYFTIKESIESLKYEVKNLNIAFETKQIEIKELSDKLLDLHNFVDSFEDIINNFGISIDDNQIQSNVENLLVVENEKLSYALAQSFDNKTSEQNILKTIEELKNKKELLIEKQEYIKDVLITLKKQIDELQKKSNAMSLSIEMTTSDLESEKSIIASNITDAEQHIKTLSKQEELINSKISTIKTSINEIQHEYETNVKAKAIIEKEEIIYKKKAMSLIEHEDIEHEHIVEQKKKTKNYIELLEKSISQASIIEQSFDAAQRTTQLTEFNTKANIIEIQIHEINNSINKNAQIRKWVLELKELLNKHSSKAVENHVKAFDPITTLLQKRLRTVYGFGDIKLYPIANRISVEVDWEGRKVRPTDYFSDSQKQILMLSIFLAARLAQTWSGFAPILLDDPVTHFDDLNVFSFIELIRGLVSASPGKMQFIISTCEERFFELMKQKFRKSAKFYKFEAITNDGPIINSD